MLLLFVVSAVSAGIVGPALFPFVGLWLIYDAFALPTLARRYEDALRQRLGLEIIAARKVGDGKR